MIRLINPWVVLGVLLLLGVAAGSSFHLGKEYAEGKAAKTEILVRQVQEQAQLGAAQAIAALQPRNVYTKQVLDREVRIVPDYSRCVHSPDGLRAINGALENKSVASSDSVVPGADPSD